MDEGDDCYNCETASSGELFQGDVALFYERVSGFTPAGDAAQNTSQTRLPKEVLSVSTVTTTQKEPEKRRGLTSLTVILPIPTVTDTQVDLASVI